MYADHHVLKVRATLEALAPHVQNVVASSAFRIVALDFDPEATSAQAIQAALAQAGYPVAAQAGTVNPIVPVQSNRSDPAWDRLGLRASKTDARDLKTAR
jgi:hypothetical protein